MPKRRILLCPRCKTRDKHKSLGYCKICNSLRTSERYHSDPAYRATVNANSKRQTYVTGYTAWKSMLARCLNPKVKSFKDYGGRGICVYPGWICSMADFYEHLGPKPTPQHSIDRINNNGDYEPGNVRWATDTEQKRNTRANRIITIRGVSRCSAEWEEILDKPKGFLKHYIKNGTAERCISKLIGEEVGDRG